MEETWLEEVIERLNKTADYIRDSRRKQVEDKIIFKNVDNEAFCSIFILVANGVLKIRESFFDDIGNKMEFKEWHKQVLKRDNFTCQRCNEVGGQLEVHHIKPKSIYPELLLDVDNGLTLCKKCHKNTDSYGGRVIKYKYARI